MVTYPLFISGGRDDLLLHAEQLYAPPFGLIPPIPIVPKASGRLQNSGYEKMGC